MEEPYRMDYLLSDSDVTLRYNPVDKDFELLDEDDFPVAEHISPETIKEMGEMMMDIADQALSKEVHDQV
jgi:hypothetical protein